MTSRLRGFFKEKRGKKMKEWFVSIYYTKTLEKTRGELLKMFEVV